VSVTAYDGDTPEEAKEIAAAATEEHMTYPCFLDKGSVWQHKVGTSGSIPYFLVIGKTGRVIFKHHGLLKESSPEFAQLAAAIERAM
jgi:hypothetical protein